MTMGPTSGVFPLTCALGLPCSLSALLFPFPHGTEAACPVSDRSSRQDFSLEEIDSPVIYLFCSQNHLHG